MVCKLEITHDILILPENVLFVLETYTNSHYQNIVAVFFNTWDIHCLGLWQLSFWERNTNGAIFFLKSRAFLFWSTYLELRVNGIHVWRSVWKWVFMPVSFSDTVHENPGLIVCLTHSPLLAPPSALHPLGNSDFCCKLESDPTPSLKTNLPPS